MKRRHVILLVSGAVFAALAQGCGEGTSHARAPVAVEFLEPLGPITCAREGALLVKFIAREGALRAGRSDGARRLRDLRPGEIFFVRDAPSGSWLSLQPGPSDPKASGFARPKSGFVWLHRQGVDVFKDTVGYGTLAELEAALRERRNRPVVRYDGRGRHDGQWPLLILDRELLRGRDGEEYTCLRVASLVCETAPTGSRGARPPVPARTAAARLAAIDAVIILDVTGSMEGWIAKTRSLLLTLVRTFKETVRHCSLRLAVVGYRDHDRASGFVTKRLDLTDRIESVESFLWTLKAEAGGDPEEAIFDAIASALDLSWRPRAHRIVLVAPQTPSHGPGDKAQNPKGWTAEKLAGPLERAHIHVHVLQLPLRDGSFSKALREQVEPLARATGGSIRACPLEEGREDAFAREMIGAFLSEATFVSQQQAYVEARIAGKPDAAIAREKKWPYPLFVRIRDEAVRRLGGRIAPQPRMDAFWIHFRSPMRYAVYVSREELEVLVRLLSNLVTVSSGDVDPREFVKAFQGVVGVNAGDRYGLQDLAVAELKRRQLPIHEGGLLSRDPCAVATLSRDGRAALAREFREAHGRLARYLEPGKGRFRKGWGWIPLKDFPR